MSTSTKRLLTAEEKQDILSSIVPSKYLPIPGCGPAKPVPDDIDQHVLNARISLARQLDTVVLYPECIAMYKEEIQRQYYRSLLAPGEMVGVIAASSIGEQNTQASLNSFHSSGSFKANLTSGLTRLNELMNATNEIKTPSLTIYFSKNVAQDLQNIRKLAFSKLIWVELEDLVSKVRVEPVHAVKTFEPFYSFFDTVYSYPLKSCSYRVRLQLNPLKLWRHQITMKKILTKIQEANEVPEAFKVYYVYSHESQGVLDAWVSNNAADQVTSLKNKEGELVHTLMIADDEKQRLFINRVFLPNVLKVNLSGVPGLKDCYYTEYKKEWRVDTKGGKLKELIKLDCVDGARCKSNDMHEIMELFGVEACKQMLREEFGLLIGKVNPRHLELLIDSMTSSGTIQRVTRFGIDRKQVGTIAKASFEMPVENFLISATFAEKDPLKGVSAAITVGKVAKIGTGFMDLMCNTKMLKQNEGLDVMSMEDDQTVTVVNEDDVVMIEEHVVVHDDDDLVMMNQNDDF